MTAAPDWPPRHIGRCTKQVSTGEAPRIIRGPPQSACDSRKHYVLDPRLFVCCKSSYEQAAGVFVARV
eukprot:8175946-Lingulodinium_polyedra.AAC.1